MRAYKKYVVIEDPHRVVLSDLPFETGQRVEVVIDRRRATGSRSLGNTPHLVDVYASPSPGPQPHGG